MQAESSYYSPQKVKSKEVLCWEQEGTTVEVIFQYWTCIFKYYVLCLIFYKYVLLSDVVYLKIQGRCFLFL